MIVQWHDRYVEAAELRDHYRRENAALRAENARLDNAIHTRDCDLSMAIQERNHLRAQLQGNDALRAQVAALVKVGQQAMSALESDSTYEQRRAAWDALADTIGAPDLDALTAESGASQERLVAREQSQSDTLQLQQARGAVIKAARKVDSHTIQPEWTDRWELRTALAALDGLCPAPGTVDAVERPMGANVPTGQEKA